MLLPNDSVESQKANDVCSDPKEIDVSVDDKQLVCHYFHCV